jgi:pimeloyl-ACP methyl ester carboxylesterase
MMRIGAADASPILFLPPLFEELNRTRALIAAVMRRLAEAGFGCWLPDLPGSGESLLPLEYCTWQDWHAAARAAAEHVDRTTGRLPALASLRGGSLIDEGVPACCFWRFAPVEGASLARDLERSSLVAAGEQVGGMLDLAGYCMTEEMLDSLRQAVPRPLMPLRTLRLASDRADADAKVEGPALWRRSEPATSADLADALADDLCAWIAQCGS